MAKFKVGDKVRVVWVDSSDWYKEGDVGEVVKIHHKDVYSVKFGDGYVGYAVEEQLERVSDNTPNWWETPEGIEWLSAQQDVEEQFLKSQEKKEEETYKVGQRFTVFRQGGEWHCILAQVYTHTVCFIDLGSGNRINDPISVRNAQKITEDEMGMIAEGCSFQLL